MSAASDARWLPIETCPKDGTHFIAAIHHGQCGYIVCEAEWIGKGVHGTSEGSCVGWRRGHPYTAYWQPLPTFDPTPNDADNQREEGK